MRIKQLVASLMLAGLTGVTLVGCGGGSSTTGTNPVDDTVTLVEISGVAEAPGGAVAMFESQGFLYALGNLLVPAASAAITGLQPVTGAEVKLIYVDNNGEQVGEPLATATTSLTGAYQLSLPAGVDFAANLVVRITGNSGFTLDAQVVDTVVDINPFTDFLLDKLVASGTQLDTLATNEVVLLKGKLDEFDLTAGADMSEMLAILEQQAGQYLDSSISAVANGIGDASMVAGDYHFGEIGLELHDSVNASFGSFGGIVTRGGMSMAEISESELTIAMSYNLDVFYRLGFPGGGLYVENMLEEGDEFPVVVDGSKAIIAEWGFEEELGDDFGWRWLPGVLRMEAMADTGMYLAMVQEAAVRYELDGTGAVDPDAKNGEEVRYSLLLAGKESTGMSNASLSGSYGVVGMAVAMDGSNNTVLAASQGVWSFDGAGGVSGAPQVVELERAENSAPVLHEIDDALSAAYTVGASGAMTLEDGVGFVANGGNAWALFPYSTAEAGGAITDLETGLTLGVKLPGSLPDMGDRHYRITNLMVGHGATSTIITSLANAAIRFNGDGTLDVEAGTLRGVERATDVASLQPVAETMGTLVANQSVTVGTNGAIDIAAINDDGGELKLDGFVSGDGKLLVLRAVWSEGDNKDVGVFIGALTTP
jgi:hypothetical protein